MNINFDEIDYNNNALDYNNNASDYNNNLNTNKYWENKNVDESINKKKNKMSYDDILSSLNLVVHNGVLQYMQIKPKNQELLQTQSNLYKQKQEKNIEPQLKNSYIFNKYFV